jgi:hypothetical protein
LIKLFLDREIKKEGTSIERIAALLLIFGSFLIILGVTTFINGFQGPKYFSGPNNLWQLILFPRNGKYYIGTGALIFTIGVIFLLKNQHIHKIDNKQRTN